MMGYAMGCSAIGVRVQFCPVATDVSGGRPHPGWGLTPVLAKKSWHYGPDIEKFLEGNDPEPPEHHSRWCHCADCLGGEEGRGPNPPGLRPAP